MKRSHRSAGWQLDLFMIVMIGIALTIEGRLPPSWNLIVDITWSVLMIAGMGLWVYHNWATPGAEERHLARLEQADAPRATLEAPLRSRVLNVDTAIGANKHRSIQ